MLVVLSAPFAGYPAGETIDIDEPLAVGLLRGGHARTVVGATPVDLDLAPTLSEVKAHAVAHGLSLRDAAREIAAQRAETRAEAPSRPAGDNP